MFVDSFVLTENPPSVDTAKRSIVLGAAIEGHFVVERFPAALVFGVYLELAFEADEVDGEFRVSVVVEAGVPGYPRATLHEETLHAVAPSEDWWAPRIVPIAFGARVRAGGEFDALLIVSVEGEDEPLASKAIFVRQHPVAGA